MRFGRTFQKHQVPVEWMTEYVEYDALKKVLKTAAVLNQQQQQQKGTLINLSDFECRLNHNINRVAEHYNRKREDCSARFQFLKCCSAIGQEAGEIDKDSSDILEALTELKCQYQLLSWFGDINRRALFRIVRKIEKRRLASTSQCQRWLSRISAKAFAFNGRLLEELRLVDQSIVNMSGSRSGINLNGSNLPDISLGAPMISINSIPLVIEQNNASAFEAEISDIIKKDEAESSVIQRVLLSSLWQSINHKSEDCIRSAMKYLHTFDDDESIGGRNIFLRVVIRIGQIRIGRTPTDQNDADYTIPAEPPSDIHQSQIHRICDGTSPKKKLIQEPDFTFLLKTLPCHQSHFLYACDSHGRNTLHYAVLYGLSSICQQLIERMQTCGITETASMISSPKWQDSDGYTPFQLALIHGYVDCARVMVRSSKISTDDIKNMSEVLRICTKLNHSKSLELLLEIGVDPTVCDENRESILHAAARFGHRECTATLLEVSQMSNMIDYQDNLLSSTALINASRSGHIRIVELLVRAGADAGVYDTLGWSAKEHAAFRGYHNIVECLEKANVTSDKLIYVTEKVPRPNSMINQEPMEANESAPKNFLAASPSISNPSSPVILAASSTKASKRRSDIVTTASKSQSIIIVTLGTMNPSKALGAVVFDPIPTSDAHVMHLDSTLSLAVSASGAEDTKPVSFDLPVFDDARAEPIIFSASDLTKVKLIFDIVPTVGNSKGRPIGRGVALLASVGQHNESGLKKGNLQGDHCIALIGINTFDIIGSVNFNLRIVAPFSCPGMASTFACEHDISRWTDLKSTMIIGHRGLGKNMNAYKALQIGENTIQSFSTAAKLGASFVEFDVQMTKDYVPVIYHDFLVGETGIDAPMHALTLEQFLYLNRGPTMRSSGSVTSSSLSNSEDESSQATSTTSPLILPKSEPKSGRGQSSKMLTGPAMSVDEPSGKHVRRVRSASMSMTNESGSGGVALGRDDRPKPTHSFNTRGFKANSKNFIQEPFTTLEEMFRKLPDSIGFNIEMKYPMMWEAEAYNMDPYAIDLNTYVDTVLQIVFRLRSYHTSSRSSLHPGSSVREIVFSSFHPDLCLLLRLKQSQIPVLFLTDAGCNPDVGDVRATSLQEAVRFASRWNLLGIVSVVDPLIKCPRLVGIIKGWGKRAADKSDGEGKGKGNKGQLEDKGLVCVSYGTGNNIPENAKLQADAGIDAVIVDHVLTVHRGLHGSTNGIGDEVSNGLVASGKN